MEPFGGGKGERSHFLLHISQCLRPPSLRRPPGLGPASLQLLRLLLAHKLVMAFPGERSTTQGARLGLGGSASQCLPPTSPPPPPSTPPPPRLPSAPPPPHQLHGSAGLGAPCPGTRPPPPLTWGTSLSISPDTPLCPVGGEETALHQLPRDPRLRPSASPPPPRLSLAAPAPRRRHPRATPTLRIRFFSMLSTAKTCSPTAGSSMAEPERAETRAAGAAADTAGSRRRPDAVLHGDLATRSAPAASARPSTAWLLPPLPAPADSLLALAQTTEPGPPLHENSCKSRTSAGGASQGPARRQGAGRASDWRSPAYRRPPAWAAGEEEGAGEGWGGGGREEVQGRDLRAGKVSWGRGGEVCLPGRPEWAPRRVLP